MRVQVFVLEVVRRSHHCRARTVSRLNANSPDEDRTSTSPMGQFADHGCDYVSSSLSQRNARSPGMKQYSPPRVMTNLGMPFKRLRTGFCGTVKSISCDPHSGSLSWLA